ncbi:hypothetical protein INR49_029784, partial [Caranx melampygus]
IRRRRKYTEVSVVLFFWRQRETSSAWFTLNGVLSETFLTMLSRSENSSALFTTVDGEPMSFFLRPGPAKSKLQPLITSKGGILCSVQKPRVILLMDPEERTPIHSTTTYRYVSTKYIYDCIEREELLNIEDYRLNPAVAARQSPRLNNKKGGLNRVTGGRTLYTPEEDAAIFSYVSKHKGETGGNRLWQLMARKGVTTHSWQSMKHHYKVQVAKRLSSAEKKETAEEVENEETDVQKPPSEDAASAQTHSADTDLTQIDVQPEAVESSESENAEAETSNLPQPGGLVWTHRQMLNPLQRRAQSRKQQCNKQPPLHRRKACQRSLFSPCQTLQLQRAPSRRPLLRRCQQSARIHAGSLRCLTTENSGHRRPQLQHHHHLPSPQRKQNHLRGLLLKNTQQQSSHLLRNPEGGIWNQWQRVNKRRVKKLLLLKPHKQMKNQSHCQRK